MSQVLLSPCAWAVAPDHDNRSEPYGELWKSSYSTLARLYEMPVVGVSNVGPITDGPWRGRKCIGCSLAVNGRGEVAAQLSYGEDAECLSVIELELTPRRVHGTEIARMLQAKGYEGP